MSAASPKKFLEIGVVKVAAAKVRPRAASEIDATRPACVARRNFVVIVAPLVVERTLFGVAENLIGFVDFLEFRLSRRVIRVNIGVILARELAVSLLDVLLVGFAVNTQNFVEVFSHNSQLINSE